MVTGDLSFAATGITDGSLLEGVRFTQGGDLHPYVGDARLDPHGALDQDRASGHQQVRLTPCGEGRPRITLHSLLSSKRSEFGVTAALKSPSGQPTRRRRCSAWSARRAAIAGSSGSIPARAHLAALHRARRTALPELLGRVLAARGAEIAHTCRPLSRSFAQDAAAGPGATSGHGEGGRRASPPPSRQGEPIAVFGDYDVDGAASVALIERFLRAHGQSACDLSSPTA